MKRTVYFFAILLFLSSLFPIISFSSEKEEELPLELLENIEFFEGMDMMDDFDFFSYAPDGQPADVNGVDMPDLDNSTDSLLILNEEKL